MDPNMWGYMYWFMLHCTGLFWKNKGTLSEEDKEIISRFLKTMCIYLTCPPCSIHCQLYTNQHSTEFNTGEDFYKYINDFHNAVNQRTNKLTYTYQESDENTLELLKGLKPEESFSEQMWITLFLSTLRLHAHDKTEATEEEEEVFRTFVSDWCHVIPFASQKQSIDDEQSIGDRMLEILSKREFKNQDGAFKSILFMYNEIAPYFNVSHKSEVEMRKLFNSLFANDKHAIDIGRSAQRHMEDQKKLVELQKQIHTFGNRTTEQSRQDYMIATITLSCVLAIVLIGVIVLIVLWKKQGWRLLRNPKQEIIYKE